MFVVDAGKRMVTSVCLSARLGGVWIPPRSSQASAHSQQQREFSLPIANEPAYEARMHDVAISLQALVAASIFFVWVVRYDNIIAEFKQYRLPDWLRDFVGILKLTLALLLLIGIERKPFAVAGGVGIAVLMACAFVTHLRVKNPPSRMVPSRPEKPVFRWGRLA